MADYPDERPRTRGECLDMPRPCPFVSCKQHLAHDAHIECGPSGLVKIRIMGRDVRDIENDDDEEAAADAIVNGTMKDTCALDVADRGALQWRGFNECGINKDTARTSMRTAMLKLREDPYLAHILTEWTEHRQREPCSPWDVLADQSPGEDITLTRSERSRVRKLVPGNQRFIRTYVVARQASSLDPGSATRTGSPNVPPGVGGKVRK